MQKLGKWSYRDLKFWHYCRNGKSNDLDEMLIRQGCIIYSLAMCYVDQLVNLRNKINTTHLIRTEKKRKHLPTQNLDFKISANILKKERNKQTKKLKLQTSHPLEIR